MDTKFVSAGGTKFLLRRFTNTTAVLHAPSDRGKKERSLLDTLERNRQQLHRINGHFSIGGHVVHTDEAGKPILGSGCNAYSILCRSDTAVSEFHEGLDTPVH